MRTTSAVIALIASAACSDGSNAGKEEAPCGASWETNPPTEGTCDSACAEMTTGSGAPCTTTIRYSTGNVMCDTTFEVDGERGCCFDTGRVSQVGGATEPQRQRRVFFFSCE